MVGDNGLVWFYGLWICGLWSMGCGIWLSALLFRCDIPRLCRSSIGLARVTSGSVLFCSLMLLVLFCAVLWLFCCDIPRLCRSSIGLARVTSISVLFCSLLLLVLFVCSVPFCAVLWLFRSRVNGYCACKCTSEAISGTEPPCNTSENLENIFRLVF